jgi:hypothetical protein
VSLNSDFLSVRLMHGTGSKKKVCLVVVIMKKKGGLRYFVKRGGGAGRVSNGEFATINIEG